MKTSSLSEAIHDWRTAIRELPDNPLKLHLGTARRRAEARVPRLRRLLLPLLILAGYTLLFAATLITVLSFGGMKSTDYLLFVLFYFLGLGSLYWMVLLCQGVFDLTTDCLGLLSRNSQRGQQLCLDECLAGAPLSNRELLAGALSVIALPLVRRVLAGGMVFGAFVLTAGISTMGLSGGNVINALLLLPLTIAAYCLSAVVALAAFSLAMIGFGLDQRSTVLASSAAAIHAAAQFIYPLVAMPMMLQGMSLSSFDTTSYVWEFSLQICGLLIVSACYLLFSWMVYAQSSSNRLLRSFWLVSLPFFLPLSTTLLLLFGAFSWGFGNFTDLFSAHTVWAFGSLAMANPLSSMGQFSLGTGITSWDGSLIRFALELLRLVLFFLMQFGALLLAARFAEHAVHNWRQAGD